MHFIASLSDLLPPLDPPLLQTTPSLDPPLLQTHPSFRTTPPSDPPSRPTPSFRPTLPMMHFIASLSDLLPPLDPPLLQTHPSPMIHLFAHFRHKLLYKIGTYIYKHVVNISRLLRVCAPSSHYLIFAINVSFEIFYLS